MCSSFSNTGDCEHIKKKKSFSFVSAHSPIHACGKEMEVDMKKIARKRRRYN